MKKSLKKIKDIINKEINLCSSIKKIDDLLVDYIDGAYQKYINKKHTGESDE